MDYSSLVSGHFIESDSDGNGFLDSLEWLRYLHKNKTRVDKDLNNQR